MSLRHHSERLRVRTPGRGTVDVTARVQEIVRRAEVELGQCTVFVHHTSASLIICENADPDVRRDLEAFAARLVPDGDRLFTHTAEGPDDMPAHVRSVLTQCSLTIPVAGGRADLGTWQGVYLWEHRHAAHTRTITVTVLGS
ncbi:secondary thiamine-phosphate synthase enzyme YjbQ [Paraliomyxa miuraensis]|uniref:secondary thiamine-phosphate synthase enzyme YjbQ n=1 Tax=Paraliomyxa miuraensis TaxID=376150 RepID=UPI002258980D|nr:secondary thiamine-phosphate synthase enzyme YjbQ [Paraliomyxa miuraensis]MCX4247299.1 secondary thiamine-phosphate synthase enzyme YjbQ [Paraliomyxa miuraensis]